MNNIELCKIFYENLHIYNSLVEYGLDDIGYKSETKNITLNAITNIEKVAQELDLYGNEWKTDLDYLNKYVIPRVNRFFKENIINKINKIKRIEKCFEEFYNDIDKEGHPLNNITRYDVFDSIEDIIQTKPKGDDEMNTEDAKEIDYNLIEDYLEQNGTLGWKWDKDLERWFYEPTGQTIREYILDNIDTILSPNILKEYMKLLLFSKNFSHVVKNMTDIQLLNTISTKSNVDDNLYCVCVVGNKIDITRKQWRYLIHEATERFIMRE